LRYLLVVSFLFCTHFAYLKQRENLYQKAGENSHRAADEWAWAMPPDKQRWVKKWIESVENAFISTHAYGFVGKNRPCVEMDAF